MTNKYGNYMILFMDKFKFYKKIKQEFIYTLKKKNGILIIHKFYTDRKVNLIYCNCY